MTKKPKSDVGPRIRICRLNCGLSQRQVGNAMGVSRSTVGSWENCRTEPKIHEIIKLAQIFRVDPLEILPSDNSSLELKDFGDDVSEPNPIYSLTKQEQQLLVSFRLLNDIDRAKFLAKITNIAHPE